jgi:succinoglycan biosynthesis transport protein ExoP
MSLIEANPTSLGDPLREGYLADVGESRRDFSLLAIAWRGRWLILLLAMAGGTAGWALLQRLVPCYTSSSRIAIERSTPRILDEPYSSTAQSIAYLSKQAELIRSASVLSIVADMPENNDLESFRGVGDRVIFLKGVIETGVGLKDELITVWAELPNRDDAAQLVNSVVDAYISKYAQQRSDEAAEVLSILRDELALREKDLADSRNALTAFTRQHPELAVKVTEGNVITLRFAALSDELNTTEIDLLQAKALYDRVKKMHDSPTQRPHLLEMAGNQQENLRDVELERQVKTREQALVSERARWGEGHPRVRLLADSLNQLRNELKSKQLAIIDSFVEGLRQNFELLDHKRSELQAAYDRQFEAATQVSSLAVQLGALQEAHARAEKVCDIIDDRMKEVELSQRVGAMQVDPLEPAIAATLPSFPNRSRFLTIGIVAGALSGLGLSWLRDLLDHRLRSVDEVAHTLQLPVLGVLPHVGAIRDKSLVGRLVAHAPRCSVAEAVRTLRTAIHFGLNGGADAKTIAVTSPSPGDGKSTVASNLAIAMAQTDQRVLLIDADLRKPTQHLTFDIDAARGLGSVLSGRGPVQEAIQPSGVPSLDILPCGPLQSNPVELLNDGFFADLLEELKGRYDKIIIDSPPVMPVADARVISAVADSTLLVLRAERSTRRLSVGARNELWRVRAERLGLVVNAVPLRKQGSYGYGYGDGYGYGHNGYGQFEDAKPLPASRRKTSRSLPAPDVVPLASDDL